MRCVLFFLCVLSLGCPGGLCGDNKLDAGEGCDDGNAANADGCEADCTLPACENGITDPGEVCFLAPVVLGTEFSPQGLVAADFNGDDALDLAAVTVGGSSVNLFLGDGAEGFSRFPDIELGEFGLSLVGGDFDNDGHQDLIAGSLSSNRLRVFRGRGDGFFDELAPLSTSAQPFFLLAGDFNQDAQPDVVASGAGGTSVDIFLNFGGGSFSGARTTLASFGVGGLTVGDFNGDTNQDLAAAAVDEEALVVLLGDGTGLFTQQALQLVGRVPGDVLAVDFTGDGLLDLAAGRSDGEVSFLTGQGNGLFSETQALSVPFPSVLAAGDLDQDGRLDLAFGSGAVGGIAHLGVLTQEAGAFSPLPLFSVGPADPRGLVLADFNADGALDAALSSQGNESLFVFLSRP